MPRLWRIRLSHQQQLKLHLTITVPALAAICGFFYAHFKTQKKRRNMSTILEPESIHDSTTAASQRIRTSFAACRLKFTWLGTTKSLSSEQKSQAAETFGAASESISAGKRLFDTCLLYTSPSPRDQRGSRMPSSA